MTLKDLEKHALSVPQCDRLIEEASRGESQFREDADALARLRLRLGFPPRTHPTETPVTAATDRRRPGQRYPKRDAVGAGNPDACCQTM